MIRYAKGNLLDAHAEALVNTVNEVGVMGKGLALMFRDTFPENTSAYEAACKAGEVRVGRMFVTENHGLTGPRWIVNFPTKKHWRQPSKIEWVRDGLADLVRFIGDKNVQSIALPPLGCGNGGLDWHAVRSEIESSLSGLADVDVMVFEPTHAYLNEPKSTGVVSLTPARALIAELVRRYWILGMECTNLEVQKLAWFLQRAIVAMHLPDPLDLRFEPNKYGPYADRLRHLLNGLDGSFLHCRRRLADAGPMEPIWFEESRKEQVLSYLHGETALMYFPALELTSKIIDGFESPLGMELLSTVDWLIAGKNKQASLGDLKEALSAWPGGVSAARRKQSLFDERLLNLALERLKTVPVLYWRRMESENP